MMWIDIASIVFICVTMNHLGLIEEIEHIYGHKIKVINCPKCASFWLTLAYGLWGTGSFYVDFVLILAISFLASYLALWLELFEGYIHTLYMKIYEKIYPNVKNDTASSDGYESDTNSTVS